jgi:hypothetical protein
MIGFLTPGVTDARRKQFSFNKLVAFVPQNTGKSNEAVAGGRWSVVS